MPDLLHKGLPVAGYVDQNAENVALVNAHKEMEERVLRRFETLQAHDSPHDRRMAALAITKLQEAFMWANRAVFKPGRVKLPEDVDF